MGGPKFDFHTGPRRHLKLLIAAADGAPPAREQPAAKRQRLAGAAADRLSGAVLDLVVDWSGIGVARTPSLLSAAARLGRRLQKLSVDQPPVALRKDIGRGFLALLNTTESADAESTDAVFALLDATPAYALPNRPTRCQIADIAAICDVIASEARRAGIPESRRSAVWDGPLERYQHNVQRGHDEAGGMLFLLNVRGVSANYLARDVQENATARALAASLGEALAAIDPVARRSDLRRLEALADKCLELVKRSTGWDVERDVNGGA